MAQYRTREIEIGWGTGAKIAAGVIGFFIFITLWMGIFTTAQYERDIITRYGAFQRIAQPGLNFKMPWIDGATTFDIRERKVDFLDQESFSRDTQPAKIDVTVVISPRVDKLEQIFNRFGTIENAIEVLIKPMVPAQLKNVYGNYTITQAINDREKLNSDVMEAIQSAIGKEGLFLVHSTPIKDLGLDDSYMKSIKEQMEAQVAVNKEKEKLEREKVIAATVRVQADAAAYQVEAKGKAEAAAIDLMGQALAKNPKYVEKLTAERWNGVLPHTMVPGSAVPFLNVAPKN